MATEKKGKKVTELIKRSRHEDLPASVGLVKLVRSELRHDLKAMEKRIDSKLHKIDEKFHKIDEKFHKMDERMSGLDSRMSGLDGRMDSLEAKMEENIASTHRIEAIVEEQRSENRIVLDGIKAMIEKQERVDERMDQFDQTLQFLAKSQNKKSAPTL